MRRAGAVALVFGALALGAGRAAADEPAPSPPPLPPAEPTKGPEAATASEEPRAPSGTPAPQTTALALRFGGGFALRRLLDIPVNGGDLGVAVGIQPSHRYALWFAPRLLLGSTENDLSFYSVRLAVDVDIAFDRLRFTPGAGIFFLGLGRAVRDDTLTSWGLGLSAALRFDVLRFERSALFLNAAFDFGLEYWNLGPYWGPTFGAGFDFDIHGTRPSAR